MITSSRVRSLILVVNGPVQGNVAVQGNVLLPGGGFDGGNDLAGDAQFREGPEGGKLIFPEIPDGLIQADHALLHDVLMIRADEEIASGLGAHEVFILIQQVFQGRVGGRALMPLRHGHHLFVRHFLEAIFQSQSLSSVRIISRCPGASGPAFPAPPGAAGP